MSDNPFESYNVEIPKKYTDEVKKFCQTAGRKITYKFAPFPRQVDFWYFSLLVAINKKLNPVSESDTSNITPASILSSDPYRVTHIQLAYLAQTCDLEKLAYHRGVFDYALGMANAGIPYVLQLLNDAEDNPMWNALDDIENAFNKELGSD